MQKYSTSLSLKKKKTITGRKKDFWTLKATKYFRLCLKSQKTTGIKEKKFKNYIDMFRRIL